MTTLQRLSWIVGLSQLIIIGLISNLLIGLVSGILTFFLIRYLSQEEFEVKLEKLDSMLVPFESFYKKTIGTIESQLVTKKKEERDEE